MFCFLLNKCNKLKTWHTTETALIWLINDNLMKADAGQCSVLVLLDLGLDSVHHCIITELLRTLIGIHIFLTEIHCVCWRLYLLSMGGCMTKFWVQFYFLFTPLGPHNQTLWYVIWLLCRWLYISCKLSELANLSSLHNCLVAVKDWMVENFLQLKSFKIELLIIVPEHTFFKSCLLLALSQQFVPNVKNLGVYITTPISSPMLKS